ncbi:MAG TPA: nicotinate-nucleotide adenylyltransferase [Acidimicrobiia bacterium]|nr:nicotinate-nucleotide adenylyltransferase [Acidimicrobiia bacterium]
MERLGIFGGTFDPVHVGHVAAASAARYQLALDRVLLVVAADPWQKHGHVVAPAAARYEMVAAAIEGVDGLEASRIEVEREGPTYTLDTVRALAQPGRQLFLIVGRDVASAIGTWHGVDELQRAATLAVVEREGDTTPLPHGWSIAEVTMPRLDVSSSDLRARIARGEPVDFLVPQPAVSVIRARGLYTAAQ